MKNVIATFILIFLGSCFVFGQSEHLKLYRMPEKNKSKTIRNGAYIRIDIRSYTADSLRKVDIFEGQFLNRYSDSLLIDLETKTTNTYLDDKFIKQEILSRGIGPDKVPYKQESIALGDINWIIYQSKPAIVSRKIGTALFFTSFLTATLIAPLVSINYGEGTFNLERYRAIAVAGSIGVGVSIPILLLSGKKNATLKKKSHYRNKPLWTFEE
jgi:hypothetical protein